MGVKNFFHQLTPQVHDNHGVASQNSRDIDKLFYDADFPCPIHNPVRVHFKPGEVFYRHHGED